MFILNCLLYKPMVDIHLTRNIIKHNFITIFIYVKATKGGEKYGWFLPNKFKGMVNKWEIINILDFFSDFCIHLLAEWKIKIQNFHNSSQWESNKYVLNEVMNIKREDVRNFNFIIFIWNILLGIVQTQHIITNFQPRWLFLRMLSICLSNVLNPVLPPFLSILFSILALKQLANLDLTFASVNVLVFLNYTVFSL